MNGQRLPPAPPARALRFRTRPSWPSGTVWGTKLDGLIVHLYGLTEEEFAYILTTFPLVPDPVKVAAHNAYRDVARGAVK